MPRHVHNPVPESFIRSRLRLCGPFWADFDLRFAEGQAVSFVPSAAPVESRLAIDRPTLGRFDDLTPFQEEESLLFETLLEGRGRVLVLGLNGTAAANRAGSFDTLEVGGLPDPYYSKLLILHGQTISHAAIRGAILAAESPFLCGAILATDCDSPLQYLSGRAHLSLVREWFTMVRCLVVEAYGGEGTLLWFPSQG